MLKNQETPGKLRFIIFGLLKTLKIYLIYSKGSGGGALMKFEASANSNTPHYMLVGLSSFGPTTCGTKSFPGN